MTDGETGADDLRAPAVGADALAFVVLALVVLPILTTVVSMGVRGWVPSADDAWVARRTMQVFSTRPPLVGQDSTAVADASEDLLQHPGPVAYYLNAVPYRLMGWHPVGLLLGVAAVVVASAAGTVWVARRAWGDAGGWCAAVTLAALVLRLTPNALVRPTSSVTVALPLLAALVGAAAYLAGRRAGAVLTVLTANYCIQTSLVVLPFAGLTLLVVLATGVVRWCRGTAPRAGAAVVGGVVALTWIPPLIDQFTSHPGNLTNLFRYVTGGSEEAHAATLGLEASAQTFAGYVLAPPWGGRGELLGGFFLPFLGPRWWAPAPPHLPAGPVAALVVGVLVLGVAGLWLGRRHPGVRGLAFMPAVAVAAGCVAFARRPFAFRINPVYMVVWIQAVAAFTWFAALVLVGSALGDVARRRAGGRLRAALAVVGVVVLVALVAPSVAYQVPGDSSLGMAYRFAETIRDMEVSVTEEMEPGAVNVVGKGLQGNEIAKGLGVALVRADFEPHYTELTAMRDEPRARYDLSFWTLLIAPAADEAPEGATLLVTAADGEGSPVGLWMVPPRVPVYDGP